MLQILTPYYRERERERERESLLRVDLNRFKEIELRSKKKLTYTGASFTADLSVPKLVLFFNIRMINALII